MENENKSSEDKNGVQAVSAVGGGSSSVNEAKVKEYESMFSLLYKQKDYQKLSALIEELNQLHIADEVVKTWQEKVRKKQSPGFLGSLFGGGKKTLSQDSSAPTHQIEKKGPPELVKIPEVTQSSASSDPVVASVNPIIPPKKEVVTPVAGLSNPMTEKPITVTPTPTPVVKKPARVDTGLTFEMRPPETSSASDSKSMPEASKVSLPVSEKKPVVAPSASVQASVVPPVVQAASDVVMPKKSIEGNTFTKMFGRGRAGEKTGSVIDQIVASSEKKKEEGKSAPLQTKTERQIDRLTSFSKVFANFTAIFVVLTAAFLYVEFIDQNNRVLGVFGVDQNTGSKLHQAAETLSEKQQEETVLERQIQEYMGGYNDESLNTLQMLIDGRINWPDIIAKITEVTNSVYELNDFFQYVQYDNYAFDAERQTIRISGTLSDPQGRNLTKLVELEDAFMNYPHDPNNPNDETLPYFQDFKELTSLRKTYDEKTGRYTSDFQLSFALSDSNESN